MTRGIILAAGYGSRLRELTKRAPKSLVKVGGRPIITYPIQAMMSSGIDHITIVVGYRGDEVAATLASMYPEIGFAYNKQYSGENATSIYAAREYLDEDSFVVAMGDHLISPGIIKTLLLRNSSHPTVCVDATATHESQISDATKVWVDSTGMVMGIGKELTKWHFVDTGVFMMDRSVLNTIGDLMELHGSHVTISSVVSHMASIGSPFSTCDVSGEFWADVDTPEDFRAVEQSIAPALLRRLTAS